MGRIINFIKFVRNQLKNMAVHRFCNWVNSIKGRPTDHLRNFLSREESTSFGVILKVFKDHREIISRVIDELFFYYSDMIDLDLNSRENILEYTDIISVHEDRFTAIFRVVKVMVTYNGLTGQKTKKFGAVNERKIQSLVEILESN